MHIIAEEGNVETMEWLMSVLEEDVKKSLIDAQDRYNGVDLCFLIRGRDKRRCCMKNSALYEIPILNSN